MRSFLKNLAYASTKEGAVGDIARASGDLALSVGDKAKEINEKHRIVEHIKESAKKGYEAVEKFDQKHGIVQGIKYFLAKIWSKSVQFEHEHHFTENILDAICRGAQILVEKIHCSNSPDMDPNTATSDVSEASKKDEVRLLD